MYNGDMVDIMLHDVVMETKVSRSMTGSFCWLKRAVSKTLWTSVDASLFLLG